MGPPSASSARFRAFLFDLDGTLIDHFEAIRRAHAHALAHFGLPPPTPEQVRAAVGGGLEEALRRTVGPGRLAEAIPVYREYWDRTMLDDVVLLPGARVLLEALHARGARCAVLTNKLGESSRQICRHLGIEPFLGAVVGDKDTPWRKPQPEIVAYALARLGAKAGEALLVGDSPYDIASAHGAGLPAWCVATGTHGADALRQAKADAVFPGLDELRAALQI